MPRRVRRAAGVADPPEVAPAGATGHPGGMRPGIRWLAYWLVVVGCFAFVAYVFVDSRHHQAGVDPGVATPQSTLAGGASPSATASPSPSPTTSSGPTTVLFVGESYEAGGAGVATRDTFARLVCAKLDWSCRYDAASGSGYLADPSYDHRLTAAGTGDAPDVVVVTSGRADLGLAGVRAATTRYLRDLAKRYPDSRLVVVEPFWNDDLSSTAMTRLRSDVHAAARGAHATWVASHGWVTTSMLAPGGLQLTRSGHQQLTRRMAGTLRTAVPDR